MSSAVTARMAAHSGTMRRARTPGARPLSSSARISGSSDAAPICAPRNETMNSSAISSSANGKNACSLRESDAPMPVKTSESSSESACE